jgi:hypothetical protein
LTALLHSPEQTPMKSLLFIALTFGICPAAFADETFAPPDAARAVPRALHYLVEKGNDWMDDQTCAACHHIPMMIWSLREAKAGGFAVDEKALAKAIEWALSAKIDAKSFPADKASGGERVSRVAAFLTLALADSGKAPPEWSAKMLSNLLLYQEADGGWSLPPGGRPPISIDQRTQVTQLITTALVVQTAGKSDAAAVSAQKKALGWLAAQPADDDTQYHALRLLLDARLSRATDEGSIAWLRARQNGDGGWGQIKDAPSDAYATSQAVYALRIADVAAGDTAIQRARDFLLKTQTADGSWPMKSQPTAKMPTGSKNLEPITYASTAWAVMALVRSGP